jgi:hypothetical protein
VDRLTRFPLSMLFAQRGSRRSQKKPGQQGDGEGKGRGVSLPREPSAPQGKPLERPPLAPLPRLRLRGCRVPGGRSEAMANQPSARSPGQESHHMQAEDAELEQFRRGVNCAALLEGWSPAWRLDRRESTRRALKYRREEGEVLIVNPQSMAKG